jgi:glucosamine--fructose-6-phosphate aminotransferase (isomerizing)
MSIDARTTHPFFMYDAVLSQPSVLVAVLSGNNQLAAQFVAKSGGCDRLFLTGIGTSYHAAQIGQHLMQAYCSELETYAWHSFDFALYGPRLTSRDCVIGISHRGNKRFTLQALERASESNCIIAVITGEGSDGPYINACTTFRTIAQEQSAAHTASYVGAIAVLASLADSFAHQRTGVHALSEDFLLRDLAAALHASLATEPTIAGLAHQHVSRRAICLVGGGPDAVTGAEIALKIKETSYLQADGTSVEALLHGPFQWSDDRDLFVLIAPAGRSQERIAEFPPLIHEIGAAYVVIGDDTARHLGHGASAFIEVPSVPSPFSALTCLGPLQLFAYYLALERHTNPDGFRLGDPRFARARALIQL